MSEAPVDVRVQYLVVNVDLRMSAGKLAAQAAHAGVLTVLRGLGDGVPAPERADFEAWVEADMRKIVLAGHEEDLRRLVGAGFIGVVDDGHTEVPPGSLTVVALPPGMKSQMKTHVRRLQLYSTPRPDA